MPVVGPSLATTSTKFHSASTAYTDIQQIYIGQEHEETTAVRGHYLEFMHAADIRPVQL